MAGAIDALVGRCSTLTNLRITTAGDGIGNLQSLSDERLYSAWARLLDSVCSNLCYPFFEQSTSKRTMLGPPRGHVNIPNRNLRLIDRSFVQHILPVLLDAPWSSIRRMEIRGVGCSQSQEGYPVVPTEEDLSLQPDLEYHSTPSSRTQVIRRAFSKKAKLQLRGLLGVDAKLKLNEHALVAYEQVDPLDTGILPMYDQWEK